MSQHTAYRKGYEELTLVVKNYGVEQFTISTAVPYDEREIPFPVYIIEDQHDPYGLPYTYKPNGCYVSFQYFKEMFLDRLGFQEMQRNEN